MSLFEEGESILETIDGVNKVALEAIGREGASEVEVGAALHGYSGFHPKAETCSGCATIGRSRLQHLRTLGFARKRRDGIWLRVRAQEGDGA